MNWTAAAAVGIGVLLVLHCVRAEASDFMKLERARKDAISKPVPVVVEDMVVAVERVRRVTWRIGILGALICAAILLGSNIIAPSQFVGAAAVAWIAITAVLNFRAYHVEDEATAVLLAWFARGRNGK